jgi:D-lactate dehydrogenase (cytochrome)
MTKRKYTAADSLFFKFQGPTPAAIKETAAVVKRTVEKHGGTGFQLARTKEEAEELWSDRKNAHYAELALAPGAKGWPTDVWCVLFCGNMCMEDEADFCVD